MQVSPDKHGKPPVGQSHGTGESMKDSMSESPQNNDNKLIPTAEDLTDEQGKLDPEAFKQSYSESEERKKSN
jgi:hypothetical protein